MPARITGIGWITAAGTGSLKEGSDFAMPDGSLPEINPASVFRKPDPYFRRMDAYSRLGVTAIALTLRDAGLDQWSAKRNIGIIAATACGCLQTDIGYFETVCSQGGIGASPALFSYTLPSVFLGEAALRFGLTGATFVISRGSLLEPACLRLALESLEDKESDRMLCGVCDLAVPPAFAGGCNPPPGAVFFMLERIEAGSHAEASVRLGRNNRIFLGRAEMKDLAAVVRACRKFI